MRRAAVSARGRVQGVFFRASRERRAGEQGVTGWVRNAPDGRVEAELQGDDADVDELVAYCRTGPGQAHVEELDVTELPVDDTERGFEVR